MAHVLSPEGKIILNRLAKETETCIDVSDHKDELLVYGTRISRNYAKNVIIHYLADVAECRYEDGEEAWKFLCPEEDGLPHDFVLRLASQMQQFYISSNLLLVKTLPGKSRVEVITDLKREYHRYTKGKPDVEIAEPCDIQTRPCVSCFIDLGPDDKCYILEGCAHVYCMECLHMQVTDAIKTTSFPVLCAQDNQPFSAADFKNITGKLHIASWKSLMKASVRDFVNRHHDSYKFCSSPNCVGVGGLKKTPLDEFVNCSTCNKKSCPKCFLSYHKFMTCDQASDIVLHNMRDWLMEDDENRKKCPSCKIGIEKNGGCCVVYCPVCSKYICWKCMRFYITYRSCFKHTRRVHGGFRM